jgi:heat shock protein HslJ
LVGVKLQPVAVGIVVSLALAGCGGGGGSEPVLSGSWEWGGSQYSDDTEAVPDNPSRYTLDLGGDGSVSVVADCNRSSGTWETDADASDATGSLRITLGPTTLAECPPGSLSTEFLRDLGGAAAFEITGDKLRIDLRADVGTMAFSSAS